jgi:hypothetical protein
MVSATIPTITCTVCGSPQWVAARPGTAADARSYPTVLELFRCEDEPLVAWCSIHEPLRKQGHRKGGRKQ